ncbi:MAG: LptA/OstA family protein, partial [Verrucomicrobiota bacterium]
MKKLSAIFSFHLIVVLLVLPLGLLRSQTTTGFSGKKFSYPIRDANDLTVKALVTGTNAKQITGSQLSITGFKVQTFRNGDINQIELIAEAPECLLDRSTSIATSSGPIKVYNASTNLLIEGVGFYCQQSNTFIVISNQVETTINKAGFKSAQKNKKNSTPSPASAGTNQILKIFADHFVYQNESNLVTYTGNVRVLDALIEMTADILTIQLSTNHSIQQINADHHVVMVNRKDHSRFTGGHAVYVLNADEETIQLTGDPVWRDGEREGHADIFFFDRKQNVILAQPNARFKFPREQFGRMNLLNAPTDSKTNSATNQWVQMTSDRATFQLTTNGSIQKVIAQTNVVIWSESDDSRATAQQAVYDETTGILELTGEPFWRFKDNEISAKQLVFDKTNRTFTAETKAHLKFPAKMLSHKNQTNSAPRWLEVFSDEFFYQTNHAWFRENVRAVTDDETNHTTLLARFLHVTLGLSNQLESIVAHEKV